MSFTSTLTLIGAAGAAEDIYFAYTVTDPGGITRLTLQAVHVDSFNNIYAAGLARPGGTNIDANNRLYVVKLDKNGNKQWDNLYYVGLTDPTTAEQFGTRGGGITTDSSGNVFITTNIYNDFGQTIIKISADGSTIDNVIADSDVPAKDSSDVTSVSGVGNILVDTSGVVYSIADGGSNAKVKTFANDLSSCTAGYTIGEDHLPTAGRYVGFGRSGDDPHWFSQAVPTTYWMFNEYDFSSNTYSSGDYLQTFSGITGFGGTVVYSGDARCGSVSPDYGNYKSYFYLSKNNDSGDESAVFTRYEYRSVDAVGGIYPDTGDNFRVWDCVAYLTSSMVCGQYNISSSTGYGVAFRHSTTNISNVLGFDHVDFRSGTTSRTKAVAVDADLVNRSMAVIGLAKGLNQNKRDEGGFCIVKLPFEFGTATEVGLHGDLIIDNFNTKLFLDAGSIVATDTYAPTPVADTSATGSFATETVTGVTYTETLDEITEQYPVGYFDFAAIANTGDSFTSGLSTAGGCWGDSGTKFYINNYGGETVYQYTASTAYDISSLTSASKNKTVTDGALARGMQFKPDGTRLFITFQNSGGMRAYDLSTAWDISTMSATSSSSIPSLTGDGNNAGMFISADGIKVFVTNFDSVVQRWDLNVAWYLDNRNNSFIADLSASVNSGRGLVFSPDGTEMIYLSSSASLLTYFVLVTPWNPQTAVEIDSLFIPEVSTPVTVVDDGSGTNLYVADNLNGVIRQYSL